MYRYQIVGIVAMTDNGILFWMFPDSDFYDHPFVDEWIAGWFNNQLRLTWMYLSLSLKGMLAQVH